MSEVAARSRMNTKWKFETSNLLSRYYGRRVGSVTTPLFSIRIQSVKLKSKVVKTMSRFCEMLFYAATDVITVVIT